MSLRVLVVAKAPVPGAVKTRLGADIGMPAAAEVAAASLADTLRAAADAVGASACHLALAGDLHAAVEGDRLRSLLDGWTVHPQRGEGFAARLVNAHLDVAATGPGSVVQVGMDTPQATGADLLAAADGLDDHDAVLGPAEDGGWWVLALRDPARATALRDVAMSTPATYDDTAAALAGAGLVVGRTAVLRDVDTVADADVVAALPAGRAGAFAAAWERVRGLG